MLARVKIDNRINAHFGTHPGVGKKPVVIHMHERYGIVQHTTDLGQKFVEAGYVTVVPDFFSRFTGDRDALARGDDRCELRDEEVLTDLDAIIAYLKTVPEADMNKVAMSGVCQTGRQPILAAAKRRDLLAAAVFHLFTHAFFKALLFLGSGSVIHALSGEQDLRRMGGLRRLIPWTFWTFVAGTAAIAGIPFLSGFFSKDMILAGALAAHRPARDRRDPRRVRSRP